MNLSFEYYWPLVGFGLLPLLWKIGFGTKIKIGLDHLRILSGIRIATIILLIAALMEPTWHRSVKWVSTVYAIDVSASIEPSFIRSAIDWVSRVNAERNPEHSSFVVFAGSAKTLNSPSQIASTEVSQNGLDNTINQSMTNLAMGLRQSMNSFESSYLKRLVLFTDGNANVGEEADLVRRAREEGIRIFTIPASVVGANDSWIDQISIPEVVRQKEPVVAEVQVYSRAEMDVVIELIIDSDQSLQKSVNLAEGMNSIPFEVAMEGLGSSVVSARISSPTDGSMENNRLDRTIRVEVPPRVLYVEGRSESAHYLRNALEDGGIDVVTLYPGDEFPASSVALESFELILMSDVAPDDLTEVQMEAVLSYVRDFGGGLIFAAGESSYGREGYSGSVIEEVLPIWFEVEEERKELSLVIVLDKSYSMVGAKLELSKEAAKAALGVMDPRHRFSVVTFDDTPYVAVPLQLASQAPRINQSISQIIAGSQTNIYPALEKAFEILEDSDAEVRHVVLLSDGKTYADDYEELVTSMAEVDISVSSVAVGEEADRELLSNIASWGNGRNYYIQDAQGVPQVFIKEAQIASQSTLIEESVVFESVQTASEMFTGLDLSSAPDLEGYVKTKGKDNAEMLIEASDGAPILASWHYGVGRTAAFTSDVKNRWAVNWLEWEGYGKFWTQVVREIMRRNDEPGPTLEVKRVGNEAIVTLNDIAFDSSSDSLINPSITVSGPREQQVRVILAQKELGVYSGSYPVEVSSDSSYSFSLNSDVVNGQEKNINYNYYDELRRYPPNIQYLNSLSNLTGGKLLPEEDEIFQDYGDRAYVALPLAKWFLFSALILFLFDIATRRLPWAWTYFSKAKEQGDG